MFARIIPLTRTPPGVDAFDYRVPADLVLQLGDLVRIPLRNRLVEGVVLELRSSSPFAARTKELEANARIASLGTKWVELAKWLGARTFQSLPTITKAWLRLLPKKLAPWTIVLPAHTTPNVLTHWTTNPEATLLEQFQADTSRRTLILVPFAQQAERLAKTLGIPSLLSDDPKTVATHTWQAFTSGETPALISTRIGAWLGLYAERLLLLEPENDDHKQDELAPRFDARLLAMWLATHTGIQLETFGLTPPLHVQAAAPTIIIHPTLCLKQRAGRSVIPTIGLDALDRFLEETDRPRVLVHPIRGFRARSQCRVCGEVLSCILCASALRRRENDGWCDLCKKANVLPDACVRCGSDDFSGSTPGIELLKRLWERAEYPPTTWRDGSPLAIDMPLPEHARVLVSAPELLGGVSEDVRRTERLLRTYRKLASHVASAQGELFLQIAQEEDARWLTWLTSEGVHTSLEEERRARSVFRYPPSVRLAKLLVDGSEAKALTLREHLVKSMGAHALFLDLRGPFLVEGRPKKRERFVFHALFQPQIDERTLTTLFTPFQRDMLIDLDPVAFLR